MIARAKPQPRAAGKQVARARDIRASILKSAAALLTEEGGEAFTIGALIERTGVARTTVYRYWSSREELLAETQPFLKKPVAMPEDSRTKILKAATILLVERGVSAFSLESLVSRTGIAKTTIYRHFPSRAELLSATIEQMGGATSAPDTGSLRGDLLQHFLRPMREWTKDGAQLHFPTLPSIIEAAKLDPETLEIGQRMYEATFNSLIPMLERAKKRGEIRADCDIEVMTHMLYGSAFIYGGMGHDLTESFVTQMIDIFLGGVAVNAAAKRSGFAAPPRTPAKKLRR